MNESGTARSLRQQKWREKVPELRELVEELSPRILRAADEDAWKDVPEPWREMVAKMQREVSAEAADADHFEEETDTERRGYCWSWRIGRVAKMIDHLTHAIRADIGMNDGATLGSIVLLERALLHLQLELQDGGTKEGREDRLENQFRVQQALRALSPRFDDMQLRRLRALQVAFIASRLTAIPDDAEVEERVKRLHQSRPVDERDIASDREYFSIDQPALSGVMARAWLVEVDDRFSALDPLVVMEEFAEASAEAAGGRAEGGEGRTGPVRALARLAVTCGALDFDCCPDEPFDAAVERARQSARNAFPGS